LAALLLIPRPMMLPAIGRSRAAGRATASMRRS
jgi:hypothetical protein